MDEYKNTIGKPLQFSDISEDVDKTNNYIVTQKDLIKGSIANFKKEVFKILVSKKVLMMIGEQSHGDRGVDLQQRNPNLQEALMSLQLMYIGGVVNTNLIPQLRKLIIRATRCQAYVKTFDCDVAPQDQLVGDSYNDQKSLFVIVCQNAGVMEDKIRRICHSLGEFTYDIDVNTLSQDIEKAENDKQSAKNVITNSKITFREYLQLANKKGQADVSVFKVYNLFVARQRSISIHLNMLK